MYEVTIATLPREYMITLLLVHIAAELIGSEIGLGDIDPMAIIAEPNTTIEITADH